MQRNLAGRWRQLVGARTPSSAIVGDYRSELWPRVWMLRGLAGLVVAVALAIEVKSSARLLA